MKFRADIEGLRGVAILAVLGFHAGHRFLPGGYIGVDVFFVISGFLITKIILDEMVSGSFSLAGFYRRRIRRILPALFFMFLLVSLLALALLPPQALIEYGKTLIAAAFFASNIEFQRLTGYFDGFPEFKPLLHTWSLAVEEQFYILFPLILLATKRWFGGRFLAVFLSGAALSLALSAWLTASAPNSAFYSGPARAFELLIGAILALDVLPQARRRAARETATAMGLGLIVICAAIFDGSPAFSGPALLLPCLGGALIIYGGQAGTSLMGQTLGFSPLRFVGAISYSLYLWHWPMLALVRNYYIGDLTPARVAVAIAAALALAVFSWRYVERPFRGHGRPPLPLFRPAAAVTAGFAALGAVLILGAGFPQRYPAESQRLFRYAFDYNPRRECHNAPYTESCYYGAADAQSVVAVWGDSTGDELAAALGEVEEPGRSVLQITSSACAPALASGPSARSNCAARNREIFAHLTQDRRIRTVVLVGRYGRYLKDREREVVRQNLERAVSGLVAADKRVIMIYPAAYFSYPVPDAVGLLVARGRRPESYYFPREQYRAQTGGVVAELDAVTARFDIPRIVTSDILCGQDKCRGFDGHNVLYYDMVHLSMSGARLLAAPIARLLKDLPP